MGFLSGRRGYFPSLVVCDISKTRVRDPRHVHTRRRTILRKRVEALRDTSNRAMTTCERRHGPTGAHVSNYIQYEVAHEVSYRRSRPRRGRT